MINSVLISILLFTFTASASVKREEYSGTSSTGSSPVYTPGTSSGYLSSATSSGSATSGSSSSGANSPSSYLTNNYQYSKPSSASGLTDHLTAAASNNYPNQAAAASAAQGGNLYYYYYPVQEKPKDPTFQTSASNQYANTVASNTGDGPNVSDGSAPSNNQDLSYSSQGEANYQNQGINDVYAGQGGQPAANANYDPSYNLASQYGYGISGANNVAYNPSGQAYAPSQASYGPGIPYAMSSDPTAQSLASSGLSNSIVSNGISSTYPGASDGSSVYSTLGANYPGYRGPYSVPYRPGGPASTYMPYGGYGQASAPQPSYEVPSASSSSSLKKYGSIIMPMLAIAGLSLLIPTVSSISTAVGRKKRSIDPAKESALGDYLERIDRYYALYKTAVQRDECMNRIICELGDSMGVRRVRASLLNFAEKFTPMWISKRIGALKSAATSNEKYGKCKKYSCQ